MGRRAKNKQGDPTPLDESLVSSKFGITKRKAGEGEPEQGRVAKKSKRTEESEQVQTKSTAKKSKVGDKRGKEPEKARKKEKSKKADEDEEFDEWGGLEGDGDSDLDAHRQ